MTKRHDAANDVTLNGVRVMDQRLADKLRVPLGETVAWAVAFPRETPITVPVVCDCAACNISEQVAA